MSDIWEETFFGDLSHDGTEDGDNDGLSDLAEFIYQTDPINWDSDGDDLPDGWEVDHGLNPGDPTDASDDSDRDGYSNLVEYDFGTNPRNYYSNPDHPHGNGLIWLMLLLED
jgi:hypothetical protein